MKVAIDISQAVYDIGVSRYTKNLVQELVKLNGGVQYVLFGGYFRRKKELINFTGQVRGSFETKFFPIPPTMMDILWNRLHFLEIEKLVGKIDVFHSSDWTQPPSRAFRITTVHDLVPLKFPQLSHPRLVSVHKRRLYWVSKEVDRIIVPSEATKNDLLKMGFDTTKIRIIPEAANINIKAASNLQIYAVKRKYRIGEKYLLAVGVNPRKNTENIIKAFEKVKSEKDMRLIIIGHPYFKIDIPRGVSLLGHVPESDLSALYSGACALVYPSFYEGFGLPILDSYACKVPVVTSNFGSMKEIAQGASVLVDPYNVDSIAEGINDAIERSSELVKKGLARLKNYSWAKTAKETLNVYKEVQEYNL